MLTPSRRHSASSQSTIALQPLASRGRGGDTHGAARASGAVDHAYPMAGDGSGAGGLQPGGSGADDEHVLRAPGGQDRVGLARLVAAGGLDDAADEHVAGIADDAGLVAQDARPRALAGRGFAGEVRVGELGAGHLDEVGGAGGDGGLGISEVDDRALQHDRDADPGPHGAGEIGVERRRRVAVGPGGGDREDRVRARRRRSRRDRRFASSAATAVADSGVSPAQGASSSHDSRSPTMPPPGFGSRRRPAPRGRSGSCRCRTRRRAGWSGRTGTGGSGCAGRR